MNGRRSPRPRHISFRFLGWLAVLAMVALSVLSPVSVAATQDTGNNGTVKIHDGAGEPNSEPENDPHVCTFHLHFMFADPVQSGTWEIKAWEPTGDNTTVVLKGTYDTTGDGEDRQPASGTYSLDNGHYKLFWDGDDEKHDKQKVFWVDCPTPTPTPTPEITPTPTPEITPTPTPTPPAATPTPTPPAATPTPTPGGGEEGATPTPTPPAATPTPTPGGGEGGATPTPTPQGGVSGATGTPHVTLPATDTAADAAAGPAAPDGWRIVLLGLASLLATVLVLTPVRSSIRRR